MTFIVVLTGLCTGLATLIASITGLILALRTHSTVQEVRTRTQETQSTINGRLDDMVHSAELRGHAQGVLDGAAAAASIATSVQGHPPVSGAQLE